MLLLFALMTYSDHKQFKPNHVLHSYRVVLWGETKCNTAGTLQHTTDQNAAVTNWITQYFSSRISLNYTIL